MKKLVIGATLALFVGGSAFAESYIVVRSSDPAVARNATFASGQTVSVKKGASLTVVSGAGAVSTLTSKSGTITLPGVASADDTRRVTAMQSILQRPQARRTFGAMRGGVHQEGDCPVPADLTTLDQIAAAEADDCNEAAQQAMEAFLAKAEGAK